MKNQLFGKSLGVSYLYLKSYKMSYRTSKSEYGKHPNSISIDLMDQKDKCTSRFYALCFRVLDKLSKTLLQEKLWSELFIFKKLQNEL